MSAFTSDPEQMGVLEGKIFGFQDKTPSLNSTRMLFFQIYSNTFIYWPLMFSVVWFVCIADICSCLAKPALNPGKTLGSYSYSEMLCIDMAHPNGTL